MKVPKWVIVLILLIIVVGISINPVQRPIGYVLDVENDITDGFNDVYFEVAVRNNSGEVFTEKVVVYAYDWNDRLKGTVAVSNGIALFNAFTVKEGSYISLIAVVDIGDTRITMLRFPGRQTFRIGNGDLFDTVWAYNENTGYAVIWFEN